MTTNYPGALDTTTQLKNDLIDATVTSGLHAAQSNNAADAILAIETELGVSPKGDSASVAARLSGMPVLAPASSQIFQGTSDVVPLVSRLKSGGVANLYEAQSSAGSVLAYITRLGALSAASFSVAGTALASTHLSDSAQLARLASPAFSGTPTAPTASPGDSSTKIATTAFVAANGVPAGSIMAFAGTSAPTGFLLLDGSAVSRATYSILFALIGTTYGSGDGSTTFNLPDLRGRTIVGKGTNADVNTLGASDGLSVGSRTMKHYHGVGSLTVTTGGGHGHAHTLAISASGSHSHGVSGDTGDAGSHTHDVGYDQIAQDGGFSNTVSGGFSNTAATSESGNHSHSFSVTSGTATHSHTNGNFSGSIGGTDGTHSHGVSGSIGTTAGVSETPAYLVLNFIIKY